MSAISLGVARGSVVGLLGRNGAGKTTLLRLLSGALRADAGDARIGGHSVRDEPVEARRRLALLGDAPALFEALTVEEHLGFVAGVHRLPRRRERIDEVLREMGLSARRHDVVSTLSRGLAQRLCLAIAFVHAPEALLLDEPFLGLDPPSRRLLEEWIVARARAGAAVLVSSHELGVLERICGRFVVLHEGRMRLEGTLEELRARLADASTLEDLFLRATDASS